MHSCELELQAFGPVCGRLRAIYADRPLSKSAEKSVSLVQRHEQELFSVMGKPAPPELKKYMDKRLFCNLQGARKVSGTLRGFDIFLNLVLDDATEETNPAEKQPMGTIVIRGNSVISLESLGAFSG